MRKLALCVLLAACNAEPTPATRVREEMRAPLAMCLYNRGLTHVEAGEREQAASVFQRSLELRPNASVERALRDLGDVAPAPTPAAPTLEATASTSAADPERAVRAIRNRSCARMAEIAFAYEGGGVRRVACESELDPLLEGEGPRVDLAYVWSIGEVDEREVQGIGEWFVVITDAGRSRAFGPVANAVSPTSYPQDVDEPVARYVDAIAGEPSEIIVELSFASSGSEDGCHDQHIEQIRVVCAQSGGTWSCGTIEIGHNWVESCWEDEEEETREHPSSWFGAAIAVAGDGTLVFSSGENTRRVTVADFLARFARDGCSLEDWED